jgi:hypothetical protein
MAGAGLEEITPYAGIPLGGHGPGGRIARGTWMPLYARAFYFEDDQGQAVALVSCDLFAIPGALRAEVLRLVNKSKKRLEPGALILSATHTHHGPGNFLSADVYNAVGSPLPNFDYKLFSFLATFRERSSLRSMTPKNTQRKITNWCSIQVTLREYNAIERSRLSTRMILASCKPCEMKACAQDRIALTTLDKTAHDISQQIQR